MLRSVGGEGDRPWKMEDEKVLKEEALKGSVGDQRRGLRFMWSRQNEVRLDQSGRLQPFGYIRLLIAIATDLLKYEKNSGSKDYKDSPDRVDFLRLPSQANHEPFESKQSELRRIKLNVLFTRPISGD
jgi:hypothetical protein